ncbi:MAG: N-acetyl-gamma-glutamyl-phosphate reductase [Meiothermus sp.]|nr:N-acetyl-gamma-glutamyl-phosphate reductase [Meiothermus sp.]
MHRVFVDGQEGTTGLQIFEYLAGRDDLEVLQIDAERRKDVAARAELLNAADVAFLCLPDTAARESATLVSNPNTCIIDASTAHRTDPGWVFGLPEMAPGQRQRIRESKRIANPGCHATAFILLVRPLVDAGIVPPDLALPAFSLTGYSGGGKKMIANYQAAGDTRPSSLDSPRPYALGLRHKHLPEMRVQSGLTADPIFVPVVGDFYKGLAVTVYLEPQKLGATLTDVHAVLQARYADEGFVRVMPLGDEGNLEDGFFDVQACNGTNRVDIFAFGREEQAVLVARLDNLGKGASGAAVQSMNVHLGLEENKGL